ncbi:MAG: threonine-phosphate decarboxylase CobD [Vagococcus sp.]|uniref:threonine-phosphate decarboxylase CobD n=1 Tax=Vagococcus sp. TaxID=1933889 RepID=UPI002FC77FDA
MIGLHGGNIKEISEMYEVSDTEIIDFSANINPLGLSKKLLESFHTGIDQILHYPDLRYKELKTEIANYHHLKENTIFLGNGAAEVIYSLADVLSVKKLLLLAPTFSEYEDAFAHNNTSFFYFKTIDNNFKVDITELMKAIEVETVDAICLCNPNNPTGTLIEKADMIKLVDYCKVNKIKLIVDEAFMDFVSEEQSLSSELKNYSELFILRSLTKIFAIPGLRLGYLLTDNKEVLEKLEKRAVPWRINCFADLAGRESLKDREYLIKTLLFVNQERGFLEKGLSEFKEIQFVKSTTNFIFFEFKQNVNLQKELLKRNILIRDCSNYKGLNGNYYRVAVRTREENQQLLEAFEEYFHG